MHRSHLRLCGIGIVVALGYLVLTGGSAGGVGLLLAALLCPLAMLLAMAVLMGHGRRQRDGSPEDHAPGVVEPR